ncbi:MAG: pyruvate formate lyase family protein [Oscillospiraceae bacterium]
MEAKFDSVIKKPRNLSPRVKRLRDYYFEGVNRDWNNEYNCYSTGTDWDLQFNEITYFIVPETFSFFDTFLRSVNQAAEVIPLPEDFWGLSIPERVAEFNRRAITEHMPAELLPQDLLCGARFNLMTSMCLTKQEQKERDRLTAAARESALLLFHRGYGNGGSTSGHLIPDYEYIVKYGFEKKYADVKAGYDALPEAEKKGKKGAELRAMMTACRTPRELAAKYATLCRSLASGETEEARRSELTRMAENMDRVPWHGARDFWEAVQSLWLTHMLVMADENFPGPGVSFGRLDQYLYQYYQKSIEDGMTEDFMKEILGCFWFHCNTAYDAQIRVGGNQGITAGFGQLFNISGMGRGGEDMTNALTYLLLDVIDDMSPILEPKPNVRLHRGTPDKLLDRVVDMISESQGAPFLLNFDERSMAGMLREAKLSGAETLINEDNVYDYASVGCLENTMVGNDRSGTVDNNINLLKAMELVYGNGRDFVPFKDDMTGKLSKQTQDGPNTGAPETLETFDKFWDAFAAQIKYCVKRFVDNYELTEAIRSRFQPTPYLSLLVRGCAESGRDVTEGGAELSFTTLEGVTFATTVDSLLAVKYLVYDKKECTLAELIEALKHNWEGFEILQNKALHRAPKYGRDDTESDEMARRVMELWSSERWKNRTKSTERQFRPGMLSWNYWVGAGYILKASANGRRESQFLSNAICPSNGADINGPTSNSNSVGKALGGKAEDGDYLEYVNYLPNGASHTSTFNSSMVGTAEQKEKFKAFLRGYIENGGTALQINILDPDMLRDAQNNPQDYRHLLVRVTGYNAYFTSIGRELQDEIIARESHKGF